MIIFSGVLGTLVNHLDLNGKKGDWNGIAIPIDR
jgi:hypothetical protein